MSKQDELAKQIGQLLGTAREGQTIVDKDSMMSFSNIYIGEEAEHIRDCILRALEAW